MGICTIERMKETLILILLALTFRRSTAPRSAQRRSARWKSVTVEGLGVAVTV